MSKQHIVEGVVYVGIPAIARAYPQVKKNTIYKRYQRGKVGDELVPPKLLRSYVEPEEKEDERKTLSAEAAKVPYVTQRKRLDRGLSQRQAYGLDKFSDGRKAKSKKYEINGEINTMTELAEKFDVKPATIRDRLSRGATVRQAVGLDPIDFKTLLKSSEVPRNKRPQKKIMVNGKTYTSYKHIASDYKLTEPQVRQRIEKSGYKPSEAVLNIGDARAKKVIHNNKLYPTRSSLAQEFSLSPGALKARETKLGNLDAALNADYTKKQVPVTFNNRIYPSIADLAKKHGIPESVLKSRLRRGMSLQDAVSAGAQIKNPGRYNLKVFEKHSEIANKLSICYFLKINFQGRVLYKVGITSNDVETRFKGENFEYEVINYCSGKLIENFKLEETLKDQFSHKLAQIIPSSFSGYTEVFELVKKDIDVINKAINKRVMSNI